MHCMHNIQYIMIMYDKLTLVDLNPDNNINNTMHQM